MAEVHYNRAPILEAVIDIQVRFNAPPDAAAFLQTAQRVAQGLSARFTQAVQLPFVGIGVGVAATSAGSLPAQTAVATPRVIHQGGLRLASAQNDRVLLLQPRGLTFSHMPPYSEWKTFRDEAAELWKSFVRLAKPDAVTRTALRYINRFGIPQRRFELSDYFAFRFELPGGIPQDVSSFFVQCQMPQADIGSDVTAIVNLGSAGTDPSGSQYILLDFDVFTTRQLDARSDAVIELLDQLRVRKNELFEACITDRARELIR
jgi:uncharacterized protein (TIGR04255 family)